MIYESRNTSHTDRDLNSSIMNITSEQFEDDHIKVTVNLFQQRYISYSVITTPVTSAIFTNGSTSFQMTLSYNQKYNLAVEVSALCKDNTTTYTQFYYGKMLSNIYT